MPNIPLKDLRTDKPDHPSDSANIQTDVTIASEDDSRRTQQHESPASGQGNGDSANIQTDVTIASEHDSRRTQQHESPASGEGNGDSANIQTDVTIASEDDSRRTQQHESPASGQGNGDSANIQTDVTIASEDDSRRTQQHESPASGQGNGGVKCQDCSYSKKVKKITELKAGDHITLEHIYFSKLCMVDPNSSHTHHAIVKEIKQTNENGDTAYVSLYHACPTEDHCGVTVRTEEKVIDVTTDHIRKVCYMLEGESDVCGKARENADKIFWKDCEQFCHYCCDAETKQNELNLSCRDSRFLRALFSFVCSILSLIACFHFTIMGKFELNSVHFGFGVASLCMLLLYIFYLFANGYCKCKCEIICKYCCKFKGRWVAFGVAVELVINYSVMLIQPCHSSSCKDNKIIAVSVITVFTVLLSIFFQDFYIGISKCYKSCKSQEPDRNATTAVIVGGRAGCQQLFSGIESEDVGGSTTAVTTTAAANVN